MPWSPSTHQQPRNNEVSLIPIARQGTTIPSVCLPNNLPTTILQRRVTARPATGGGTTHCSAWCLGCKVPDTKYVPGTVDNYCTVRVIPIFSPLFLGHATWNQISVTSHHPIMFVGFYHRSLHFTTTDCTYSSPTSS